MKYYNLSRNSSIQLEGSIALSEGYSRFLCSDIKNIKKVNIKVSDLSKKSSGITAKFVTDSRIIILKTNLSNRSKQSNMTPTLVSGFDLYIFNEMTNKYEFYSTTIFDIEKDSYEFTLFENNKKEYRKFLLYFPMYSCVNDVYIGLEEESKLEKGDKYIEKIIIYGTSITQGASASRPGLTYTNIISRRLNVEVFNYGFSGNALLEKEVATILSKVKDASLLIIDVEPNAGVDNMFIDNLPAFVKEFRKNHKNMPILLVSRFLYPIDKFDKEVNNRRILNNSWLKEFVNTYKDDKVYYLNGELIFDKDYSNMTIDGLHPNDLGMKKIANAYIKKIKEIKRFK